MAAANLISTVAMGSSSASEARRGYCSGPAQGLPLVSWQTAWSRWSSRGERGECPFAVRQQPSSRSREAPSSSRLSSAGDRRCTEPKRFGLDLGSRPLGVINPRSNQRQAWWHQHRRAVQRQAAARVLARQRREL